MRAAGIGRENARAALRGVGIAFDNNLWTDAAPPPNVHLTPIVGRQTDAQFPYEPLA